MSHANVLHRLRGERRGAALPRESAAELGENGMEPDPLDPANAEREQRPLVLEPAELPLDRGATSIERLPALCLARDQGMQPVGLDPPRAGLALASRAAPLRRAARGIGPGEGPRPMLALRRAVVAALPSGVPTEPVKSNETAGVRIQ